MAGHGIKAGHRVRVTIEAPVTWVGNDYIAGAGWEIDPEADGIKVENLGVDLPEAHGSVVQFTAGGEPVTVLRDATNKVWRFPDGSHLTDIRSFSNHKVIYNAGKDQ